MNTVLWRPGVDELHNANISAFRDQINSTFQLRLSTYPELYEWSVRNIPEFWEQVWHFTDIIHSQSYNSIVDDPSRMPGATWFKGARLNFAENLLRSRDNRPAIHFQGEGQTLRTLTHQELFYEVEKLAHSLRDSGIQKGDRVAGFMPNMPETVIAMLATASIGAVWSSSSPDFGIKGVLDRFSQIEPRIIFASNGYYYNGKEFDSLGKLWDILTELPSVEQVIVTPYLSRDIDLSKHNNATIYSDFISDDPDPITFEQLPFDHPLYIMYSSGTTGLPKSIVHGSGGTLIQHLKELRLHTNLNQGDTIFYFTTCGWMMWNWLVSSLAVGATIVLYDGSPLYPDSGAMWKMAQDLGINVFGTSAKFIDTCNAASLMPNQDYDLSQLRAILSTGSPLVEENFDYVYHAIKNDVLLSSISGGTDLISCFALGNPTLPVVRGELQCRGLGMDVRSYDQHGRSVTNKKGELVCTKAFPSMPIHFWNDPDGSKYQKAYFETFPGIWHHGDYIEINDHGGVKIYGRSDATLNPGGVRIGTAEIYRVVEAYQEVEDSLVIGQEWEDDQRVILFLKMSMGNDLSDDLMKNIKNEIRTHCSPRHVPAIILETPEIPYTINGKKVEIAVRKIIAGSTIANQDALANPDSLGFYKDLPELRLS
ncbi:MAG: acetoacetate--CoA ligase [Candidatus Marinimicrobia bacterium]|nr:acetoacetate--CoA ligase [Candidatus Neomarinimicrobiota bacterium]|tara:strand:+ start:4466 stop:6418 length:1953 start_codon:yes stop_codon:yes gene_type:complete